MSRKPVRPSVDRANPFNGLENLLTNPVFLIGNGKSREGFDLEQLRPFGTIIGCNALYRDFSPDILVTIDAKMINEINKTDYCKDNVCIVPIGRKLTGGKHFRTKRFNTSGCFAMQMISRAMKPKYCFMLGMDCYPGNMYDKTPNYSPNTLQNFTGVSRYYLESLQGPGDTIYINVNEKDTWPNACHETGKYKFITYKTFNKILQEWKD